MIKVKIDVICEECETLFDLYDKDSYLCETCVEDTVVKSLQKWAKEALTDAYEKDYLWKDKDGYAGWNTEKEKEIFMRGIKHGYERALYWIADYYDLEEFVTELMDWK